MAKKPKAAKEKKGGAGSAIVWVVAVTISLVAASTMVLLLVGMLPTLIAFFIVDRHPAKYTTRTVGYLNFAGCLPYALDIWRAGDVWDFTLVLNTITDPWSLMVMYAAAATGWIIHFSTPPVVAAYLAVASEIKVKKYQARQNELVHDWGRNVRYGAMGEELQEDDDPEDEDAAVPADAEPADAN